MLPTVGSTAQKCPAERPRNARSISIISTRRHLALGYSYQNHKLWKLHEVTEMVKGRAARHTKYQKEKTLEQKRRMVGSSSLCSLFLIFYFFSFTLNQMSNEYTTSDSYIAIKQQTNCSRYPRMSYACISVANIC
jgi:hypothetical protein